MLADNPQGDPGHSTGGSAQVSASWPGTGAFSEGGGGGGGGGSERESLLETRTEGGVASVRVDRAALIICLCWMADCWGRH